MTSEAVKVIVRCRPLNGREHGLHCKNVIDIYSDTGQCSINNPNDKKAPPKNFFFDGAFDTESATENIYNDISYPLVEGVTEGYNGTIFAYGQTGCGKSFTMQGVADESNQRGIIPRAFDHIFETISVSQNTKFLVHASFLEIYNEEIRDLLARDVKARLDLKEHPDKGVYVAGLTMHKVTTVQECQVIMGIGWKNRSTGATLMNADSSRSHSIFTIYLEMVDNDLTLDSEKIKAGKLNLVDLAGSERQSKTGAAGDRFKEATKINLSLSALGNVISALVDSKVKHIPYRDSKLTRLLQDSLGGNTKTLMIACLSPADNNYDETLSTLRYANRAKSIQNKPKINEDPKDALLRQYQEEINRLRLMLDSRQTIPSAPSPLVEDSTELQLAGSEKERLKQEYEIKLRSREEQYNAEAADKAKLMEEIQTLREYYENRISQIDEARLALPSPKTVAESVSSSTPTGIELNASSEQQRPDALIPNAVMVIDPEGNLQKPDVEDLTGSRPSAITFPGSLKTISTRTAGRNADAKTPITVAKTTPDSLSRDELLQRLSILQGGMVGGEQASNPEVRARHNRRLTYAEERKRHLAEANNVLEDDGIMVGIYETIQDQLCHKNKLYQREKQKAMTMKVELDDIQSEFEQDRADYLDMIRRQQRQMDLLESIIDRVQPCIRRDCNYHNVDKIKRISRYDDEKNEWVLPPMTIERTQLPLTIPEGTHRLGSSTLEPSDGLVHTALTKPTGIVRDLEREHEEESRYYAKLASRTQSQPAYFANRRANQLLIDAAASRGNNTNSSHNPFGLMLNSTEPNPLMTQNLQIGNLPGALADVLQPVKRHNKLEQRGLASQYSPVSGKQRSPSHRKAK